MIKVKKLLTVLFLLGTLSSLTLINTTPKHSRMWAGICAYAAKDRGSAFACGAVGAWDSAVMSAAFGTAFGGPVGFAVGLGVGL
jgi:hypothetical protein